MSGTAMTSFGADAVWLLIRSVRWTLLLTGIALGIGGLLGAVMALLRLSGNRWVRQGAAGYIGLIQSIPVLMILFQSYYGLPLAGVDLPPLLAAGVSLSIYASAYFAEIWRGAIEAVPHQQWEASASLALTRAHQYRYVILPQALRQALPPTVGFLVQLVKNTSIVSVVGLAELARTAQLVNNATVQPFKVFGLVALIYFVICFPLSRLSRVLERRLHAGRAR